MRTRATRQNNVDIIIKKLYEQYPVARIELHYSNTLELLVATILSAQCTDKQVNRVTESLFKKYRVLADYVYADRKEFERDIRSTGFFRNKTKNIMGAVRLIAKEFDGHVPDTMDYLLKLPGVARKTANIVLYNAFGKQEGIAVDTHVKRLSRRLGLSRHENTEKIEKDLMALVPRKIWGQFTYWIIAHGRTICAARTPRCAECVLQPECEYYAGNSAQ